MAPLVHMLYRPAAQRHGPRLPMLLRRTIEPQRGPQDGRARRVNEAFAWQPLSDSVTQQHSHEWGLGTLRVVAKEKLGGTRRESMRMCVCVSIC